MPFLEYEKCNPKISLGYNSLKLLSEKSIAKRYSLLISKDWYSQTHPIDVDIHKKITVLDNKIKKNIILDLFSKTVRTDIGIVLLKGNALNLIYGDYKKILMLIF